MTSNRAGKFIKIGQGQSEYSCFVPSPLPLKNENDIKYDSEMIYLISESNRHIGKLDEVTDSLISPNYFVYIYARKEVTSYIPPSAEYLGDCLDNFEKFMHEEDKISPLIKAAILHSHFEMIHPFLDGNGRLGRLLITLYISVNNILHRPTLYLSKYLKKHRSVYYDLLSNIHQKGQYEEFIKFFLTGIIQTSKEAVEIARNITELKNNDIKKISSLGRLSESALTIYESLFSKPTIRIEEVSKLLNVSVSTAGRLLNKLVGEDILKNLNNKKKDKIFVYQKYIDIFNQE